MAEIELRAIERETYTEYHLCVVTGPADAPAQVFTEVAELLQAQGVEAIQEKIYGRPSTREALLGARAAAWTAHGRADSPVTFLVGAPVHDGPMAGLQLWGLASRTGEPLIEDLDGGRRWSVPGYSALYLPAVTGDAGTCVTAQGEAMFARANAALNKAGLRYDQVLRTWIYMGRILDWYGEFNRVRTVHHESVGLRTDDRGAIFPASTGIQGVSRDEECLMDVLAVAPEGAPRVKGEVTPIHGTARQQLAFDYGSAFSRGMSLAVEGVETVFVSGTASLNAAGETLHFGRAIPRAWFGAGKAIGARKVVTMFGIVSVGYEPDPSGKRISATVSLGRRRAPGRILVRFRHPDERLIRSVRLNDRRWRAFDPEKGDVDITGTKGRVRVEVGY